MESISNSKVKCLQLNLWIHRSFCRYFALCLSWRLSADWWFRRCQHHCFPKCVTRHLVTGITWCPYFKCPSQTHLKSSQLEWGAEICIFNERFLVILRFTKEALAMTLAQHLLEDNRKFKVLEGGSFVVGQEERLLNSSTRTSGTCWRTDRRLVHQGYCREERQLETLIIVLLGIEMLQILCS